MLASFIRKYVSGSLRLLFAASRAFCFFSSVLFAIVLSTIESITQSGSEQSISFCARYAMTGKDVFVGSFVSCFGDELDVTITGFAKVICFRLSLVSSAIVILFLVVVIALILSAFQSLLFLCQLLVFG